MKSNLNLSRTRNKRIVYLLLLATSILLVPIILQFTIGSGIDGQGFNWSIGDFVIVGILLFGLVFLWEFLSRKLHSTRSRVFLFGGLVLGFLYIWAELAVGVFL